jgi:hypothetical protein
MAEYEITKVSSKPPRSWSFNDKKTGQPVAMETYKVLVKGEDDPIDVNRKTGNPPTVGEVLSGTLETTDFGRKFKPERKSGPSFGGRDQDAIKAQWAIGQAVGLFTSGKDTEIGDIEKNAKDFFLMVDRVKQTAVPPKPPATAMSDDDFVNLVATGSEPQADGDDLINLNDPSF